MPSLPEHCHGEKTHFSRNEKRTFSLSQTNNAELARTLSWRENALFEEREKNEKEHAFIETLKVRATTGLKHSFRKGVLNFYC